MTRVSFDDDEFDPPAPVLPVRVGGMKDHDPAAMLRMLVDTGADCTLIPARIAKSLRLPVVDKAEIQGVGGKAAACSVHAARVRVGNLRVTTRVVALGDECLLGRDVLNKLVLTIDGPALTIQAVPPRPKRKGR